MSGNFHLINKFLNGRVWGAIARVLNGEHVFLVQQKIKDVGGV